jgi:hypothetical protein
MGPTFHPSGPPYDAPPYLCCTSLGWRGVETVWESFGEGLKRGEIGLESNWERDRKAIGAFIHGPMTR